MLTVSLLALNDYDSIGCSDRSRDVDSPFLSDIQASSGTLRLFMHAFVCDCISVNVAKEHICVYLLSACLYKSTCLFVCVDATALAREETRTSKSVKISLHFV
jgi:hypothetical protein